MMLDKTKPFSRCYGRTDGGAYYQCGCFYNDHGELVNDAMKSQAQKDTAAKAMSLAYSREALKDIAEAQGMEGLKTIAKPLGVTGRSKQELITAILETQADE